MLLQSSESLAAVELSWSSVCTQAGAVRNADFTAFCGLVTPNPAALKRSGNGPISSHFCSADRQFRFPDTYGGQRTPTAQWTATASGCAIVAEHADPPYVQSVTVGTIKDMGIKDANNMGAAMAGAAYETITAHLKNTGLAPEFFDLILTGDLGDVGAIHVPAGKRLIKPQARIAAQDQQKLVIRLHWHRGHGHAPHDHAKR